MFLSFPMYSVFLSFIKHFESNKYKLENIFTKMDYDLDGFVDIPEIRLATLNPTYQTSIFSMFFYDHFQNELGTKTLDDFATAVLYYINKFQE